MVVVEDANTEQISPSLQYLLPQLTFQKKHCFTLRYCCVDVCSKKKHFITKKSTWGNVSDHVLGSLVQMLW